MKKNKEKKLTIIQVLPALESGGVERGTLEISKYLVSISKPIYFLLFFIHAIAVVPDPIQLSRTTSFSLEYVFIKYSINNNGFCVGCFTLPSLLNFKILRG